MGFALVGVFLVALAAHLLLPASSVLGTVAYLSGLGVAVVAGWLGVAVGDPSQRRATVPIALGVTVWTAANVVFYVYFALISGTYPAFSVADVLWWSAYLPIGLGLVRLNRAGGADGALDVDAVIDASVGAVVGLLVTWVLVLDEIVLDGSVSPSVRVALATYPVLDVVLLSLVVRVMLNPTANRPRAVGVFLVGLGCWLVADVSWLATTEDGLVSPWVEALWMVAMVVVAGATLVPPKDEHDRARSEWLARALARGRIWIILAPLALPGLVELRAYAQGEDVNPVPLLAATAGLIGLAAWRTQRLLRAAEDAREELNTSNEHFRALAANSADAVVVLDESGCVFEGAGNLGRLLGVGADRIVGVRVDDAPAVDDHRAVQDMFVKALTNPGLVIEDDVKVHHEDGHELWLATRVVNLLDQPAVRGVVVNIHDVTDKKRAEEQLTHQAFHDGLTGLANRALFMDRVEHALRRGGRSGADPAIAFIDIDGFKSVNDRFGHEAGDRLLREIAARILSSVRSADTVARLGGDEFAILVEENHPWIDEATTTAERVLQALSVPLEVEGQPSAASASIGVAVGDPMTTADELLRNADIAMYRAKASGKAQVVVYRPEMGTEAGEALELEADLAGALSRGELELFYQPVVSLSDERVVGFEALLRWWHPRLGLVPPDRFIPVAEATDLIVPIGQWVLHQACLTAVRWQCGTGDGDMTMAVNLSARQLASDDIVDHVREALDATGLRPSSLVLEMTETALVEDAQTAAGRLERLSALGVRLAVDDFGTGYSSLSYLRQFPIDILKIDRSFIETITDASEMPPIVRGLLDLGHTLELEVVAEGIELDVQRDWLRSLECELGQGFLFSKPLPAPEIQRLLEDRAALSTDEVTTGSTTSRGGDEA